MHKVFGCDQQKWCVSCYFQEVANVFVGTSDDYRTEQLMLSVEEDNQQNQNLQNTNLQDDVNQNLQPTQQKENLKGTQCSVIRSGKVLVSDPQDKKKIRQKFQVLSMHVLFILNPKGYFWLQVIFHHKNKMQKPKSSLWFSVISKECISSSVHNV